jgi:hypothetical protein
LAELQKTAVSRFVLLDTNHDGRLSLGELQAELPAAPAGRMAGHGDHRIGGN